MHENFEQDREKMVEVVLYLSSLSVDDPNFGMTKLVKLLYYSDCASYALHGKPITGTTYLHFPHGPFPENWYQVREQMERNEDVDIVYETVAAGYCRYRMLPRRAADIEMLSPDERAVLEEQVSRFARFNAAGIEEYSHQEIAWLTTEDGQPLEYSLSGIVSPPLSERTRRTFVDDLPF